MKIYKNFFLSLCINTIIFPSTHVLAMEAEAIAEKSSQIKPLVPPAFFSSAQEMVDYGHTLYNFAFQASDLQEVIDIAEIDIPINYSPISFSDMESYHFNRVFALSSLYMKIVKQQDITDLSTSHIYYENAINYIDGYLEDFGSFHSSVESFNHRMLAHRALLNQTLGKAYNGLIALLGNSPEGIALMPQPIKAFKDSLAAIKNIRSVNYELFSSLKPSVPEIKFGLLQAYCNQALAFPFQQEQEKFLAQARNLRNELKGHPDLYSKSCKVIMIAEKNTSALKKMEYKGGKRLEEFKKSRAQEEIIETYKIMQQLAPSPQHALLEKCKTLSSTLTSMPDEAIIAGVKEIEEAIALQWKLSPQDDLEKVYEYYRKLMRDERITINDLHYYILAFIKTEDLDGALRRADVLLHLSKNNAKDFYLARILYAGLKNLKGEPEMWLLLGKELADKAQEVNDKKKQAKERRRQKKAALISESLESLSSLQDVPEPEKKPLKALKHKEEAREKEPSVVSFDFENSISDQEAKLAKLKRHEEAEKIRAQQAQIKSSVEITPEEDLEAEPSAPASLNREEDQATKLQQLLNSSNLKLRDLYSLSGRPLRVDQEIEEGNWRFTREELQAYLETLGCIYKPTSSNHRKIALPKATYVMHENDVITIFNEFGGALTLPAWEKDYVPNYLRGQILAARDKLRALKIQALNAGS